MRSWRPALRMARRDLRRHKVRAALTCVLVALPIFVATIAAQVVHNNRWTPERSAQLELHGADAAMTVSEFTSVRPKSALRGSPRPAPGAQRRDPDQVALDSLLPAGSRTAPQPQFSSVTLATGGQASVILVDLRNPMTSGMFDVVGGRAPEARDEVAIPAVMGRELGVVDEAGDPKPGATVGLVDGTRLRLVGVLAPGDEVEGDSGLVVVGPVDSVLAPPREEGSDFHRSYLVDLPAMSVPATKKLARALASAGVTMVPRDSLLHPKAWGLGSPPGRDIDLEPLLVGALCVLVGLIEVVLLVGAAFAVAARRQVRDLGLLATNGGAARDVRRTLLAQGVVLGALSSAIGAALGLVAFSAGARTDNRLLGGDLWRHDVSWLSVAVIGLLGASTSVVAALLPAWRLSRLTPVDALSGRFPIRPGESRAHRPAFVLAGGGLVILLAGGWATAEAAAKHHRWESAAALLAGTGLVLLVAGVAWSTPYVVRSVSVLGRGLPLSGRYAFRDAGRHRFRSAAAVMALMITVAGAVLAGFAFRSAIRSQEAEADLPPHSLKTFVSTDDGTAVDERQIAATVESVRRFVGPVETVAWFYPQESQGGDGRTLLVRRGRAQVQVTDEASLARMVRATPAVLAAFRAGAAVTTNAAVVRDGTVGLGAFPGARQAQYHWTVPAVAAQPTGFVTMPRTTFVSAGTAERLGFVPTNGEVVMRADRPITRDMLDRLEVYGISAWSNDPTRASLQVNQYAGLAAAALLTALVVGMTVAMAAAESRDDIATLAAVGAGPWRRRGFGAMHGLFLGIVGCGLGIAVGVPAGVSFTQLDGLGGVDVPWLPIAGTVTTVLVLSWVIGGVVTPSRFRLTRRTA